MLAISDEDEASLLLLVLAACARGNNDADRPFLALIRKYPDPSKANPANNQEAAALVLLNKIFSKSGGAKLYGRIHDGAGDEAFKDVQAALAAAAKAISGINDLWDLDPPHPRGTAIGIITF